MTFIPLFIGFLIALPPLLGFRAAYQRAILSEDPEALSIYRRVVFSLGLVSWLRTTALGALFGGLLGGLAAGPIGIGAGAANVLSISCVLSLPATVIGALLARGAASRAERR